MKNKSTSESGRILKQLKAIERKEKIKILYAVESGSRAWGFESIDSDYDIRFVYVRPPEWYLSIGDKRDVLEYPQDGLLDFSGWDIRKALQLYKKSNRFLFEWLISPTIYIENGNFAQELRNLMPKFYSPRTGIHHYLHMANTNYKMYLAKKEIKSKKYFYVLRPVFAALWIEKYNSQPPMEFERLFKDADISNKIRKEIEILLVRKRTSDETDREKRIEILNKYLLEKIEYIESIVKTFTPTTEADINILDEIFRNEVSQIKKLSLR